MHLIQYLNENSPIQGYGFHGPWLSGLYGKNPTQVQV